MDTLEVYRCLNDIVETISKEQIKNKKILQARGSDGYLIIINLDELQNNQFLEDAYVFQLLFGINENSPFGNYPIQTDKDGHITILNELCISSKDWHLFISFIKNGFPPYYLEYKNNNKIKELALSVIEDLNRICTTFGSIPAFDIFYNKFYEEIDKVSKHYNPKNPEEDSLKQYRWALTDNSYSDNIRKFEISHKISDGWSAI